MLGVGAGVSLIPFQIDKPIGLVQGNHFRLGCPEGLVDKNLFVGCKGAFVIRGCAAPEWQASSVELKVGTRGSGDCGNR